MAPNDRPRGGWWLVVAFYVTDGLLFGQGLLTFVATLVMLILGLIDVRPASARRRSGVMTLCAYGALPIAVFATIHANNALARRRAEVVIEALQRYRSDHGVYPRRLEALVPRYLPSVPLAKYALVDASYHYHSADGETGSLWYVVVPPFGRAVYFLREKRWTYMG